MSYFNLSCYYAARDFVQVGVCNNAITNGVFGNGILLIVFFISFITMLSFGQKNSFIASLFITTLASVLLVIMQMVSADIMLLLTIVTALGTLLLFRTREN